MLKLDEKLDQFLASLPEGFSYGVQERLNFRQLLLTLSASGELPRDPLALKTMLAPLVCSTPQQQKEFHGLFEKKWRDLKSIDLPDGSPGSGVRQKKQGARWPIRVAVGLLAIVLGALGAVAWKLWPTEQTMILHPKTPEPPLVPPPKRDEGIRSGSTSNITIRGRISTTNDEPIKGADVWIPGQRRSTSADGTFVFTYGAVPGKKGKGKAKPRLPRARSANSGTPFLVAHPKYRSLMGSWTSVSNQETLALSTEARLPPVGSLSQINAARYWKMRDPVKAAFSPRGDYFSVVDSDGTLAVYAVGSSNSVFRFRTQIPMSALAFTWDATRIAASSIFGKVEVFEIPAGNAALELGPGRFTALAFSPDGNNLVSSGADGALKVIDARTGGIVRTDSIGEPIYALAFRPSEPNEIVVVGQTNVWLVSLPNSRNATKYILSRVGPGPPVESLQFDRESHYVVMHRRGGPIDVWDAYGQRVKTPSNWPTNAIGFGFSGSDTASLWIAAADRSLFEQLRGLRWIAPLLPAGLIAAWLWWLYWKRSRLNRLSLDREMVTRSLTPPQPEPPFRGQPVRALAREMQKRKHALSLDLATEPTIHATVRSAGFFTPLYATRTLQREFLILANRTGSKDQREQLYTALVQVLSSQGALIDLYTFHSSPSTIRDRHSNGWIDLKELAARHPDHDLWIIADPADFLEPFTLTLPDWLRELSRWQDRVVLSPVEVDERLRGLLEAEGIRVGFASVAGMTAVLAAMEAERVAPSREATPFPAQLRHLPLRWVERASPGDRAVGDVMERLPKFLGPDGMVLAGACSVYPETFGGLTQWLAQKLIPVEAQDDTGRQTAAMVRVTSLPSFRHGRIPDWMRAKLVNCLDETDEARVRAAIEEFLTGAKRGDGELIVARPDRGDEAPVRDYVMFSFLLGRKVDEKLAVKPPSVWLRMLFEGGRYVFGPRLWLHGGAAVLLGVLAWLASGFAVTLIPARVELTEWKMPEPPPVTGLVQHIFPPDPLRRAIVEVADSMVGKASSSNLEQTVVAQAALFAKGSGGVPNFVQTQRPAPGVAYDGGFIESVSNNTAVVIESQAGQIRRLERTLWPGTFRDYSGSPVVGRCEGPELLFDNWNTGAAQNGGKTASFDTHDFSSGVAQNSSQSGTQYCLVSIATYHWNDGKGAAPGKIGIVDSKGNNVNPGPWTATGQDGQFGAKNVGWVVNVPSDPPVVLDGKYFVRDSSPATWSQNATSKGIGFVRVRVKRYAALNPNVTGQTPLSKDSPAPLLKEGHPVDWWFVFKLNAKTFPECGTGVVKKCPFGGTVQNYQAGTGLQFAYASSENGKLQQGSGCAGESTTDPLGATFGQVYNGTYNYLIWNDQFYQDPKIKGCDDSCSSPWGHSKGMIAWDDAGDGFVLQVTTPSWPASGSAKVPRNDGNTLGCVDNDDNVEASQHFFALKLTKDDLVTVLKSLQNASVVTDPTNPQIVKNGGPADVQDLVKSLGVKSKSKWVLTSTLSSGVTLISKPSDLNAPPWQIVSSLLNGVSLRAATWWARPAIESTTATTKIGCWSDALGKPGVVEIATSGMWAGKKIGLKGGPGQDSNHAKIGVSTSGPHGYAIFGDMNQQGTLSVQPKLDCDISQNGRGGLFYVIDNKVLADSVGALIKGTTAPTSLP